MVLRVAVIVAWLETDTTAAFATPPRLTVATVVSDELHATRFVMFNVPPLTKVPVAVNDWLVPWASVTVAGVTVIETTLSALTVNDVVSVCPLKEALIVVEPGANPVANPPVVMVATAGVEEDHVTESVTSCWGPTE